MKKSNSKNARFLSTRALHALNSPIKSVKEEIKTPMQDKVIDSLLQNAKENAKNYSKSQREKLVNILQAVEGDLSNIQDGVVNERQMPRMLKFLEDAQKILKEMAG